MFDSPSEIEKQPKAHENAQQGSVEAHEPERPCLPQRQENDAYDELLLMIWDTESPAAR